MKNYHHVLHATTAGSSLVASLPACDPHSFLCRARGPEFLDKCRVASNLGQANTHPPTIVKCRRKLHGKMAWRNQGITGSNNIPLGKRRFGGDAEEDGVIVNNGSASPNGFSNGDLDVKRGRSPERTLLSLSRSAMPLCANCFTGTEHDGPRRRKKRNRWGDATENKAAGLMGLPTAIVADMTTEQLEAYTLHLRIEEITQKLKIDDVVPADGDRYVGSRFCIPVAWCWC